MNTCSICGKSFDGYGHNAQPISEGICCDICNFTIVIPKRFELSTKKEKKS